MYEEFIAQLAEKSRAAIHRNPDDYIKDGLLYCGKCHTPKQAVIPFGSGFLTPMVLCACEAERRRAEEEAFKLEEKKARTRRMKSAGFPDAEMCRWTFAADDGSSPRLMSIAQRYVDNFPKMRESGKGLLLYGETGTGKSFAAACIVNALIERGHKCLMTNFARVINQVQSSFEGKQEVLDDLNKYSLLVLDDMGAERDTSYMQEIVFNIIDSRYRSRLPLVVTTNLRKEEFINPRPDRKRICSRLYEMCIPIKAEGIDRREAVLKRDSAQFAELLGIEGD